MMNDPISVSGKTITFGGTSLTMEYPVAEAFWLDGKLMVLFDSDAYTEKFGQFKNLFALTPEGRRLWTAELPTTESGDRYFEVSSRSGSGSVSSRRKRKEVSRQGAKPQRG